MDEAEDLKFEVIQAKSEPGPEPVVVRVSARNNQEVSPVETTEKDGSPKCSKDPDISKPSKVTSNVSQTKDITEKCVDRSESVGEPLPTQNSSLGESFNWDKFAKFHEFHEENKQLKASLQSKESEMETLKDALITLQDEITEMQEQDTHVVSKELARKNRNLHVLWQRERAHREKSSAEMDDLQKKFSELQFHCSELKQAASEASVVPTPRPSPTCKSCARINLKLAHQRSEIRTLKSKLTRTEHALRREVGDDIPTHKLLDVTGNWRGRAQEILRLKNIMKNLKSSLTELKSTSNLPKVLSASESLDEKHKTDIERISKIRKEDYDDIKRFCGESEEVVKALKQKLSGQSARMACVA
eukprot:14419_1